MKKLSFALYMFGVILAASCGGRNVGTKNDAGVDAQVSERIIEYTVRYSERGDIRVESQEVQLIEVTMKNLHASEIAMVSDLAFQMYRSPWWNVENHVLFAGGSPLSGVSFSNSPGSLDMSLDFANEPGIEAGQSVKFLLQGDIWEGICTHFDVRFSEDNTYVLGGTTDLEFAFQRSAQSEETPERLGVGDWLVLSYPAEVVPEQTIPAGAANVPVVRFVLQSGVPASVQELQAEIRYVPNMWDYLSDPILIGPDDLVWATSWFNPDDCPEADRCFITFVDDFDLETCAGDVLTIALTFEGDAPDGTLTANLNGTGFDAINRSTSSTLSNPITDIAGNDQQVVNLGP